MKTVGLVFKKKSGNRRNTETENEPVKNTTPGVPEEHPEKDKKED